MWQQKQALASPLPQNNDGNEMNHDTVNTHTKLPSISTLA